jgi:hypothetical protein
MLSSRLLDHVFVSRVSQTRENILGVKGSMLSSRLLDDVFMSRVSQTRDYPLQYDYCLSFDSHGTRTHDLTDARRACYPLHNVYCLWFDVRVPCESNERQ